MMRQGVSRYILVIVLLLFSMKTQAQDVSEPLDSIIKTLKLKEVVVKAKKIRQSGDTISYAASSYISKDDKVLEDLLRKMPGVEVIGNGQIKYNGQWVNEFYIHSRRIATFCSLKKLDILVILHNLHRANSLGV